MQCKFQSVILVSLAFLHLLLISCTQIERAKDTSAVKGVIMHYHKGLIHASKTGEMTPLNNIASDEVLRKLYFWIAAWDDADMYMDAELKEIQFRSIMLSGNTAKVTTAEDWLYNYRSLKTKQVVLPTERISYEMEYTLNKNSAWTITLISIKKEEKKHSKE